jgi:hypothetical protein
MRADGRQQAVCGVKETTWYKSRWIGTAAGVPLGFSAFTSCATFHGGCIAASRSQNAPMPRDVGGGGASRPQAETLGGCASSPAAYLAYLACCMHLVMLQLPEPSKLPVDAWSFLCKFHEATHLASLATGRTSNTRVTRF